VISHLHQDHIGGLPELSKANIVISDAEWQTLNKPMPEARGVLRSHIDRPGLRRQRIDPQTLADPTLAPFTNGHDLFGDGSMVLLPTPGHTPGSRSMLVRRPGKVPLLLVGDLTYDVTRPTAEHHAEGRRPRITAHIRPRLQARRGAHRGLWPTMPTGRLRRADPQLRELPALVNRPGFGAVGSTGLPVPGTDISPPRLDRTIRSARCMDLQRQTRHDDSWPRPCRPNRPWMASACSDNLQLGSSEHGRGGFGRVRQTPVEGKIMDKWRSVKNSTIIRVTASASTLVALAALVGAGYKWN